MAVSVNSTFSPEKSHPPQQGTLHNGLWIKNMPSCYTSSQIAAYLSRIEFPTSFTEEKISRAAFPATLENLRLLVTRHLLTFPYENTTIHYTEEHAMDISPDGLFKRLVVDGSGSYCFGQNCMLLRMMRGLGYRCYGGAGRVMRGTREAPAYTSHGHILIFVQPFNDRNQTFLVDGGFGTFGPTGPILLSDAEDNILNGMDPTERHRLVREAMPDSSLEEDEHSTTGELLWSLQLFQELDTVDPKDTYWKTLYTFSEREYFEQDYEDASYVASMKPGPGALFINNIFVTKHFLVDEEEASTNQDSETRMNRVIMFGDSVKRFTGGTSVKLITFTTELERIKALRDIFGIKIDDEAAKHIIDRPSALKSQ